MIRLTIGFWSKSWTCPDFGFERAGHNKFQSIFQEKSGKLSIFDGTFFKKVGLSRLKVRRWTAYS
jgi:hypothetical protein